MRLMRIHDAVAEQIDLHEPDAVVLEESYVGADARIALFVGQARGAVLVACAHAGVSTTEYAPATVKQAVCGYGRAEKEQVQRMVKAILGLHDVPKPHHASDALAVAICHALAPPLHVLAGVPRRRLRRRPQAARALPVRPSELTGRQDRTSKGGRR